MNYTPTKEELEELWFKDRWYIFIRKSIRYAISANMWYIGSFEIRYQFYPQSLEDIKTLIRLLTPHE